MKRRGRQRWNMAKRILAVVLAICMICTIQAGLWNTVTVQAADRTITQDETWGTQTLAAGTYTIEPGVTVAVTGTLTVNSDVTIKGGGKLVRDASAAYFAVSGGNLTLQNIEIDGASLSSSNAMIDAKSSAKVTLGNGCWIHHCYKNDDTSQGAALRLNSSSAVFQEAVIENCQAKNYGGAIYLDSGSSLIIHSGTYKGNRTTLETASYGGGFLYNKASRVEIYGGNFINNTSAGYGGCIYNTGVANTETYLYGGYFQGNQSTYEKVGSGAVFYSSRTTNNTIFSMSGNVQFCGDDVAGSGTDGVYLDLGSDAIRKAKISSELIYPLVLYLEAQEGRVIAEGVDGYTLQEKDMKKIFFTDIGSSGEIWYAKLDEANNQIILTTTNPGYGLYVTYAANGGTGVISDSREYFSRETVTVKSGNSLHRDGYIFGGWNTKPDGTGTAYQADDTFQITDDVTLYAQWAENQGPANYTVTYNKNNGTITNESNYKSYTYGTGLTLPKPERTGYTFGGWYTNSGLTGTAVTKISETETGDKTYYAKWTDETAPVIGVLTYNYQPKNVWQWLIGKEKLVITVPVTEEGSGADEISYTVTSEGGTASTKAAAITSGKAQITVPADFEGTIVITCTDKAGNTSASVTAGSSAKGFLIEDNAPQIDFQVNDSDVSAEAYDTAPDVTVTVTDDKENAISAGIASVTYQIGDSEEITVPEDFTTSMKTSAVFTIPADEISAGVTEITVKALDHAGNTVTAKQTVRVKTDAEKVADAKKVVEETLAGIRATNSTTKQEIQEKIDTALSKAGISGVTVTVGDLDKKEATASEAGSIIGSISITSGSETDSVPVNKTIGKLPHTHKWIWVMTKEATADEEGEMTGTCTCGETTTEGIPKNGESGTVIVREDAENECNGSFADKEDVKGKVSLTDTEKEQLGEGEDLVIILRLKDVDAAADTQEKTEIRNKLNTNIPGTFLDIELLKQIGDKETKITETTDEIEITFEIPEHLRNTDNTVTRTYQIMRNHDGVVDILDVENYDKAAQLLTFRTDKFSTYALVYKDATKSQPNPTSAPGETAKPSVKPSAKPGTVTPTPGETVGLADKEKRKLELHSGLKAVQTGKKLQVSWGKVNGADGYSVYVQYCGKNFTAKSLNAVKSGKAKKITIKRINGKKLDTKKSYKMYVVAYKKVGKKKSRLAKTLTIHIAGKDSKKYTNVKSVRVKKTSYTLKKGESAKLQPKAVLYNKRKKQLSSEHTKQFRYMSSNKRVAAVTSAGKIKAKGPGKCSIYVFARNGCKRKIRVKVK